MIRTQIQLNETTHRLLKNRAHSENRSMSALVRDAVNQYLQTPPRLQNPPRRKLTLKDFTFIGSGRSSPDDPRSLSIHHDDIFAEAALE